MILPNRFLVRMAAFVAAVGVVVLLLGPGLVQAFVHAPALNGLILGVFVVGIVLNFRQVLLLRPEAEWLESWRRGQPVLSGQLRLLAPMASMMGEHTDRVSLSAMALRSVLDSIASRLDEQRDLARYLVGLMIFLGLLGTFWGLSQTVGSVGEVIRSLDVGGSDPAAAFNELRGGLAKPLSGMGTAFSTSLFGLAGSLVLGFLDLQAGQAQNAFYNELEEWLAGLTRLGGGSAAAIADGEQSISAFTQALLERTADGLDNLQRVIARGEEGRAAANTSFRALTDKLSILSDQMRAEQALLLKLGEHQLEMKPLMARLVEASASEDDSSRLHLRNIDITMTRLVDETIAGREELVAELRSELRLLARTVAAVADDPGPER
ncbi:MAG: flagellar motor protein MotA [Magnetospirillum sp.]|nr:flagellar motor protein MotA [Magnetospirillum sp.]